MIKILCRKKVGAIAARKIHDSPPKNGEGRRGNMGLLMDSEVCNACRMCELACSFHHRGVFAPHDSSVKVSVDFKEGKIQLSTDDTCDLCPREPQPCCVQYCLTGALKKEEPYERR